MNNTLLSLWNKSKSVIGPFSNTMIVSKERSFAGRAKNKGFSRDQILDFRPGRDDTFSVDRLEVAVYSLFNESMTVH